MEDKRIQVGVPGARERMETWVKERGGVQVWNNINLSNPGAEEQFTPAFDNHITYYMEGVLITIDGILGEPTRAPSWSVARGELITDLSRFRFVKRWEEVARFHVAIRRGSQGLSLKCTDASSARIWKSTAYWTKRRGVPASYHFDYDTQEAVIEVPEFEP